MFKIIAYDYIYVIYTNSAAQDTTWEIQKTLYFAPKPQKNYFKRSPRYSDAVLWNEFPQNVRGIRSLINLKEIDNSFAS